MIAAAIYQTGKFNRADSVWAWGVLAGSGVGLVASTVGRLYSSAYYALRDTRTPVRFAILRVGLTTVLGYFSALFLPKLVHIDSRWGVAGLTASAGFAAWVEFLLLRRGMNRRIGRMQFPVIYFAHLWVAALAAAGLAWDIKLWLHPQQPQIAAALILVPYGAAYLGLAALLGVNQAGALVRRVLKILK